MGSHAADMKERLGKIIVGLVVVMTSTSIVTFIASEQGLVMLGFSAGRARRAQGDTLQDIGTELGVSTETFRRRLRPVGNGPVAPR